MHPGAEMNHKSVETQAFVRGQAGTAYGLTWHSRREGDRRPKRSPTSKIGLFPINKTGVILSHFAVLRGQCLTCTFTLKNPNDLPTGDRRILRRDPGRPQATPKGRHWGSVS